MLKRQTHTDCGFTLLELLTAIAVIVILTTLLVGVVGSFRSRARRAQCVLNLKALYVGAELYVQQYNQWPQIAADPSSANAASQYAAGWIAALEPFGVTRKTWICPEIETELGNPDYTSPENVRIDYFATPFDDKPNTPHQWPTQPWFIERGSVHGDGNLIIFTDGHVSGVNDLIPRGTQ